MGETPRRERATHRAHRQDRRRRSDQELLPSLQEPPHRRCPPAANRHPHHARQPRATGRVDAQILLRVALAVGPEYHGFPGGRPLQDFIRRAPDGRRICVPSSLCGFPSLFHGTWLERSSCQGLQAVRPRGVPPSDCGRRSRWHPRCRARSPGGATNGRAVRCSVRPRSAGPQPPGDRSEDAQKENRPCRTPAASEWSAAPSSTVRILLLWLVVSLL
jgi:hypothetical protein